MKEMEKQPIKNWEIAVAEVLEGRRLRFKVTRRFTELNISEAKYFLTKEEAKKQVEKWLS